MFVPRWFLRHFEKLTGIDIAEVMPRNLSEKSDLLLRFAGQQKKTSVQKALQGESRSPHGVVAVLMALLDEPVEELLILQEDVSASALSALHCFYALMYVYFLFRSPCQLTI